MANETIGRVQCGHCGSDAAARRNRKSKLYYQCPRCGLVQPTLPAFQDWMESHMQPAANDEAPAAEKVPPAVAEKPAANDEKYDAPKKRAGLGSWLADL